MSATVPNTDLPPDLLVPTDDGAADHLVGTNVPDMELAATDGRRVSIAQLSGRTVVFCYPRTGEPGRPVPDGWDAIPGARGCTPQACSFRDLFADLTAQGVDHLFGFSAQSTAYQAEAAGRLALPFPVLSDESLDFSRALRLPLFEAAGMTLTKRLTMVIDDGRITKVFYPVFPPDRSAADVLDWLEMVGRR